MDKAFNDIGVSRVTRFFFPSSCWPLLVVKVPVRVQLSIPAKSNPNVVLERGNCQFMHGVRLVTTVVVLSSREQHYQLQ